MSRPNFLVVMTDQQRADHLGCYGNPHVRTPTIDGLAAKGRLFESCYVASPMCMPNRASFMTGRMPSLHGVRHNGIPLSLHAPTFVEMLRADGYDTALIGKGHLQNMEDLPPRLTRAKTPGRREIAGYDEARREDLRDAGYRQELPSSWRDPSHDVATPYYGFDRVELCDEHGDLVFGAYERWLAKTDAAALERRGPEGALPGGKIVAPQAWRTAVPVESYPTTFIGSRVVDYLDRRGARNDDRPFFLMCSFPDPHHPFTPPGRYWDMYDPAQIPVPPSFTDGRGEVTRSLAWLHAERAAGKAPVESHRVFALDEAGARQATALTYGMVTLIDDTVAKIMGALERLGLSDNTVVIFTSDHGDFMGDHGLILKGPLHYRGLVRVPLIWSDPQAASNGRSAALVSTIDIPETILHRAGLASPNGFQGASLLDCLNQEAAEVRDALLIEDETQRAFLGFTRPIRVRTLVTRTHRLSLYGEGGAGEFYDLVEDPHEMRNLWDHPAAQTSKTNAVDRLARAMLDFGDRSPLPTGLA